MLVLPLPPFVHLQTGIDLYVSACPNSLVFSHIYSNTWGFFWRLLLVTIRARADTALSESCQVIICSVTDTLRLTATHKPKEKEKKMANGVRNEKGGARGG